MIPIRNGGCVVIVLNFIIACLLFTLFQSWGWLHLAEGNTLIGVVLIAGVVNTLVSIGLGILCVTLLAPVIVALQIFTLGLISPILSAVFVYFSLYFTGQVTGLFSVTTVWWQAILFGLIFAIVGFRNVSDSD